MRGTDQRAACSDKDFMRLYDDLGPLALARRLKQNKRSVYKRRQTLERKYRRQITPPAHHAGPKTRHNIEHAARLHYDCLNGIVLVGSDAHIWPGPTTTAMRGFIKFAKELKPRLVVMNGDVMDHPQISRHPPIGWEKHPTVEEEIRAAQDQLCLIEDAVSDNTKLIWTLGNHDGRFETRLATVAPEYARLAGFHLKDHFPAWAGCWAAWVNADEKTPCVIKHRYKGGTHATHNNVVAAGTHMVTGHLHSAKVTGYSDYTGTRWGVDTGCLADPDAQAFVDYTEDGPKNWRSAFAVLTFHKGKLLPPELATVWDKRTIAWRGELIAV